MAPMIYSVARIRGKLIHEKNMKSKISCETPFKYGIADRNSATKLVLRNRSANSLHNANPTLRILYVTSRETVHLLIVTVICLPSRASSTASSGLLISFLPDILSENYSTALRIVLSPTPPTSRQHAGHFITSGQAFLPTPG
jgi:hypothetical protein